MINQQNFKIKSGSSFQKMCPFPVGYVYLSSNNTSPAATYGGTWSSLNESRYLRLAGAWGTGGSNTISVDQMPSHTHSIEARVASNLNPGGTVFQGSTENANWFPSGAARTTATGGGQHSIQVTETCMLGTEQLSPKEGDKLCVTFKTLGSKLALLTRRFVHSQLGISICQRIARVQQALTVGTGRLSQIVGSCNQAVRGTQQAVVSSFLQHIRTSHRQSRTHMFMEKLSMLETGLTIKLLVALMNLLGLIKLKNKVKALEFMELVIKTTASHLTAPVMLGIEPPKVGVAYA